MADGSVGNIITVSSAEELDAAIASAQGGETILLASGDYGELKLNQYISETITFDPPITIASADHDNMASFSGLALGSVNGITFDHVIFDYEAAPGAPSSETHFVVDGSSNITITNSQFIGDVAEGVDEFHDGFPTGHGVFIRRSSDIVLDNNEFSEFGVGLLVSEVVGIELTNSEFHSMSRDGLNFAGVQNVLIEGNYFHDFTVNPDNEGHRDFIQFFTNGTNTANTDVVIRENFLDSGEGPWTQSIFITNEPGLAGQNFLIEDNLIYNAHLHGITIGDTNGLIIRQNTIVQNPDTWDAGAISIPRINIGDGSTDVSVTFNVVDSIHALSLGDLPSHWQLEGNVYAQRTSPEAPFYYDDIFLNALAGGTATIADLRIKPEWTIEHWDVGASLSHFDVTPAEPDGFIITGAGAGLGSSHVLLDASNIYGPTGQLDLSGATVTWNFGDGTPPQSGVTVTHFFAQEGNYDAVATVTLADGTELTLRKTVDVTSPFAVSANFEQGFADLTDDANHVAVSGGATRESSGGDIAVRLKDGAVTYTGGEELAWNSEYTLLVDFKKDVSSDRGALIAFPNGFFITLGESDIALQLVTQEGTRHLTATNVPINDSNWHTLALTFSGIEGTARLYIDGEVVGTITGLEGAVQPGGGHGLSLGSPWGNSFDGLVDDLHFITAAFSAEQIAAYDSAAGLDKAALQQAPAGFDHDGSTGSVGGSTDTGSGDSSTDTGSGDSSTDTGSGDSSTDTGSGDNSTDTGSGDNSTDTGSGDNSTDTGSGDSSTDTGSGDNSTDTGSGDNSTDTGSDGAVVYNEIIGTQASETLRGTDQADLIIGNGGSDTIHGQAGDDRILSGNGRDIIRAGDGTDYVDAGADNDVVRGQAGDDILYGNFGNDRIHGGHGDDFIEGGADSDRLVGGEGADTFSFQQGFGEDRIIDFEAGVDHLDFSAHSGVQGLRDLNIQQVGKHVIVTDDSGGRIVVANTDESELSTGDFIF